VGEQHARVHPGLRHGDDIRNNDCLQASGRVVLQHPPVPAPHERPVACGHGVGRHADASAHYDRGDSSASGSDNGLADSGEATISGQLSGDTYVAGSFSQQLSALDTNNDGCVELPTAADPTTLARCTPSADTATSPSATKQQVVRSVVTHELGHGTGVNTHTVDSTDIMYLSTINYTRDGHFSATAAGLVQIHNKGLQ